MRKISLALALCMLFSFGMSVIASAEDYGVMPCYNNVSYCNCYFDIVNGTADARVIYNGNANTTKVTAKVLIEKKALLGLVWSDVKEWTTESTQTICTFQYSMPLGTGTYRCSFEVTFEGTGGSSDVITDEITVKYS